MNLTWLRAIALAEAVTYLALLAAVVAKRGFGEPAGVSLVGPIHGVVFLAYFAAVIFAREDHGWGAGRTVALLLAAVIPLGGLWAERRLLRPALDGR